MEKHNKYTVIGLKALQRATAKVVQNARRNNYKIPIWRDGHIEYEIPEIITEQGGSVEQNYRGPFEK
ncbi:MAG TPA: hypothetical protein ENK58_03850 [Desulfobacterales bacterium]|nr:hypothetical protein [Desulfobacterales bacterium]